MIYVEYLAAATDTYDIGSTTLQSHAQENEDAYHPGNSTSAARQLYTTYVVRQVQSLSLSCKEVHYDFEAEVKRTCISSGCINMLSISLAQLKWPNSFRRLLVSIEQCTFLVSLADFQRSDASGIYKLLKLLGKLRRAKLYIDGNTSSKNRKSYVCLKAYLRSFVTGDTADQNYRLDTSGRRNAERIPSFDEIELHFDGVASRLTRSRDPQTGHERWTYSRQTGYEERLEVFG